MKVKDTTPKKHAEELLMNAICDAVDSWLVKQTEFFGECYTEREIELVQDQMNKIGIRLLTKLHYDVPKHWSEIC